MSYVPTFPGDTITTSWLYDELQRIAVEMNRPQAMIFDILYEPPDKPQEGMLVCADGTSWNPGSGAGMYNYLTGAWHKL